VGRRADSRWGVPSRACKCQSAGNAPGVERALERRVCAHPGRNVASGARSESSVRSGRVDGNGTNGECNRHVASAARPAKATPRRPIPASAVAGRRMLSAAPRLHRQPTLSAQRPRGNQCYRRPSISVAEYGWNKLSRVSQNRVAVQKNYFSSSSAIAGRSPRDSFRLSQILVNQIFQLLKFLKNSAPIQ
jgi:hypothetical protein